MCDTLYREARLVRGLSGLLEVTHVTHHNQPILYFGSKISPTNWLLCVIIRICWWNYFFARNNFSIVPVIKIVPQQKNFCNIKIVLPYVLI